MSALRRLPSSFLTRATTTRTLHTTPVIRHVRAADPEAGGGGGAGAKVSLSDANKAAVNKSGGGSSGSTGNNIDADAPAKGRTGGGEPLASSSDNAPPKPKITNQSVPGNFDSSKLTKEQREEVERHNKEFDAKHDSATVAPEDKVDKKFWSGEAH